LALQDAGVEDGKMKTTRVAFSPPALAISLALSMGIVGTGCATTSAAEEQRQAQSYQRNSDAAAKNGQYEVAGQQQRKAQESQNKAVMKSMDEGNSVPRVSDSADPGHQPQ